ncbi:MAG: C1 family peptidase [Rhodospirillaceae bacterium]
MPYFPFVLLVLLLSLSVPSVRAEVISDDDEVPAVGTGLEFESEAVYRSFPAIGLYRAFLPPSVDLSKDMPPVGSQGSQSSCVAWAASYGLRGYYENKLHEGSGAAPSFSPSYVYNQIKERNKNCDVGTYIPDALNLMKRVGTVPLASFPYNPKECSRLPEPELASQARPYRIKDWKRLEPKRIDDIKGQLYAGNPVVIGMQVNDEFHKLRGEDIFSDDNKDGGGHAMVVAGYDDRRSAFKLFNSWGRKWGNNGYGWVDYDTFAARTRSAYVMQVNGASPEPEPAPRPAPAPRPPAPPQVKPTPAPAPAPWTPAPVPVLPRPAPAPGAEPSQIKALLDDVPCSVLKAERTAGERLTVRGVVGQAGDRDRLAARVRELVGPGTGFEVAVMPWPQCEVRGTFAPALERPDGLTVKVRTTSYWGGGGGASTLKAGAALVMDLTMPSFPSYLYVIYLQAGGDAVYLYTPATSQGRPLPAGTKLTIGDGSDGQSKLLIGPPFGDEMILAVAAPFALTATALPETMMEREFLSLFRKALLGRGTRGVTRASSNFAAAAYTLLTTKP